MSATTNLGGVVTAQTISVAVTAAAHVIDATLATIKVPGDATILDVILTVTDMDSASAGTVDVGDTDDDDRFIAAFSTQAAGTIRASDSAGLLEGTYTYSTTGEQAIDVTVKAAPTTAVAGTVGLTVIYHRS